MNKTIIYSKNILAGADLTPYLDGYLIIADGKIEKIGKKSEITPEDTHNCKVIDLGDLTLLPGMIECHNHITMDARLPKHLEMMETANQSELTILALKGLKDDLLSGVTTARSLGDKYYIDVVMKEQIKAGAVMGPNLLISGIGMRGIHGHGFVGTGHCGVESFRQTARENMKRGVDILKIFVTPGMPPLDSSFVPSYMSPEEIRTVVEEGNRLALPTAAHCIGGAGLKDCLDMGVAVIEHGYAATEKDLELMLNHDCWLDLTSGIFMDETREEFLSPTNAEKTRRNREKVIKNLSMLVKGGLRFTLGTDAYHGYLYRELEFAVQLGASPLQALKAVTSNAAIMCGLAKHTGSIEPGLAADIIAVDGDPLYSPSCLKQVDFVMKDGVVIKV